MMKILLVLTLLIAFVVALDMAVEPDQRRRRHATRKTNRPLKHTGKGARIAAARRPDRAPSAYKVGTDMPSLKRTKDNLKKLPADMLDARRRLKTRQATGSDFYECPAGVSLLSSSKENYRKMC
jgi:hypothetical protein